MKKASLFLVVVTTFFGSIYASEWVRPSSCSWATMPALSSYPVKAQDLRDCVSQLIDELQKDRDQLSTLRFSLSTTDNIANSESEMRRYMEDDIRRLREQIQTLSMRIDALENRPVSRKP